jgi:hypothetical protein
LSLVVLLPARWLPLRQSLGSLSLLLLACKSLRTELDKGVSRMLWRWVGPPFISTSATILVFSLWLSGNQRRGGRKWDSNQVSGDGISRFIHFNWCKNIVNIIVFFPHQSVFYGSRTQKIADSMLAGEG